MQRTPPKTPGGCTSPATEDRRPRPQIPGRMATTAGPPLREVLKRSFRTSNDVFRALATPSSQARASSAAEHGKGRVHRTRPWTAPPRKASVRVQDSAVAGSGGFCARRCRGVASCPAGRLRRTLPNRWEGLARGPFSLRQTPRGEAGRSAPSAEAASTSNAGAPPAEGPRGLMPFVATKTFARGRPGWDRIAAPSPPRAQSAVQNAPGFPAGWCQRAVPDLCPV